METLVRQAQSGNLEAFETLVSRQRLRLYCIAMRHTGNYDDASDVCQEALTRAWQRLGTLQDPARFSAWLEQIVIHLSYDVRRKIQRQKARTFSLDEALSSSSLEIPSELGTAVGEDETVRNRILEQEITVQLLRAIESLPQTLREAAFRRFIEGQDCETISRRLGIEYEAARKRVYRASLELRQRLQPLYDELLSADT